jgi:hypothetical protein
MTSFDDSPGYRSWGRNSPQSTPPALELEEQPAMQLLSTMNNYIEFPDPEQIHSGSMIYHSNSNTPPSDGGHRDGTQETVDRWTRSVNAKFTEGSSDSVRPSPPSSSNGDDLNPFQQPEEDSSELVAIEINEVSMDDTHSALNDIDL